MLAIILLPVVLTAALLLLTARSLHSGSAPSPARPVQAADQNPDHYPHALRLRLSGMDTERSARRVQDRLNALDGVWAAEADWSAGTLRVLCKSVPDTDALRQAVSETGCTVLRVRRERAGD